jgi:hypothetical protein
LFARLRVRDGAEMRAVVAIVLGIAVLAWGERPLRAQSAPALDYFHIDLETTLDDQPDYACVVSADRPLCGPDGSNSAGCGDEQQGASLTFDGGTVTLTGKGFSARDVGSTVTVTSPSGKNDGEFVIAKVVDDKRIEFLNPAGVKEKKVAYQVCSCSTTLSTIARSIDETSAEIARRSEWKKDAVTNSTTLEAALSAIADPDKRTCHEPSVCGTSIALARNVATTDYYVRCVQNSRRSGEPPIVVVLALGGATQPVKHLSLEGSRLTVTYPREVKAAWVSSVGGHYVPGAVQDGLRKGDGIVATVGLERRCVERTLQLPTVGPETTLTPSTMIIKEVGAARPMLNCEPGKLKDRRLTVQVPLGREGVTKSLSLRNLDEGWGTETSWSSRVPPKAMLLDWSKFSFDLSPDCILPDPEVVGMTHGCPEVRIDGVSGCTRTRIDNLCHYTCSAASGSAVSTPAVLSLRYADIEWTEQLSSAFGTVVARPPAELRRLYFTTIDAGEVDAIELHGPRGFRQLVDKNLQGNGEYGWVSMPGLQCSDTISYRYHGRFQHFEKRQRLGVTSKRAFALLRLDGADETLGFTVAVQGGGGVVHNLLGRGYPYISIGGTLSRPFLTDWLEWRPWSGARLAWQFGAEAQFTERPYRPVAPNNEGERREVTYQRQLIWYGLGLAGVKHSMNLWVQGAIGRGLAMYSTNDQFVGGDDFIWGSRLQLSVRLRGRFAIDGMIGWFADEAVRQYRSDLRGDTEMDEDIRWRLTYGGQLRVRL